MNIQRITLGACVVLGLTALSAAPVVNAAAEAQVVIEDLTVPQLRAEIEKIQTEFYRVFNTLNENDEFDVVCQKFTPTGSNIPQIGCEPNFLSKRRGANANEYRLGTDELIGNAALIKELQPEFEQLTASMNEISTKNQYFKELGEILRMLRGRLNEINQ
jgi:septation ring formation regulator EzrA